MLYEGKIWVGTGEKAVCLLPQMANRHGLIAGATGTGKTVSLKVLAMSEKPSASTFRDTVFPVPVAPAIRP